MTRRIARSTGAARALWRVNETNWIAPESVERISARETEGAETWTVTLAMREGRWVEWIVEDRAAAVALVTKLARSHAAALEPGPGADGADEAAGADGADGTA